MPDNGIRDAHDPPVDDGWFHRLKGSVTRALGWATGDRRVEAEGRAEEATGRDPTDRDVRRAERQVKAERTEIVDTD
jgi:uncharacterized protein YjbJ (UPF0337 family)